MADNSLPPDILGRVRYPTIVDVTAFLNDPFSFNVTASVHNTNGMAAVNTLEPMSSITQLAAVDESVPQYDRDQANFVQVDFNGSESQYLSVSTFSPLYNREKMKKIIDVEFTQFLP